MKSMDILNKIYFYLLIGCMLLSAGGLLGISILYNP